MRPDWDRRNALRAIATSVVGAATSGTWVESLTATARQHAHAPAALSASDWKPRVLDARQNELVIALTELIIPETDTPGAKAALVNRFIDGVLHVAQPAVRDEFLRGLAWLDQRSTVLYGREFVQAGAKEQTDLLTRLSAPRDPQNEARVGLEFFEAIKRMTINGYYTTEVGLRKELGDDGQLALAEFQGCDHPEHF
jgi:hypothetical protein